VANGRAIYIAIVLWLPLYPISAESQLVTAQKLCIFSAAQRLPNIPGLSITASRAKQGVTAAEAANKLVDSHRLRPLNDVFDFVPPGMVPVIETPGWDRGLLTEWLASKIKGSLLVEIEVKAAAQDAIFAFICAWGRLDSLAVAPMGMTR